MTEEIRNRVAESKLVVIDLEDYYLEGERTLFDISPWLVEGIILVEKQFRDAVNAFDWNVYENQYVALYCKTDAIVPSWAFNLVAAQLNKISKKTIVGDLKLLETIIYEEVLSSVNFDFVTDKPVIIKGCSNKPVPETAYISLANKIQDKAISIMYGEACSAVPIVKNKKR